MLEERVGREGGAPGAGGGGEEVGEGGARLGPSLGMLSLPRVSAR